MAKMPEKDEALLWDIIDSFNNQVDKKFRKGRIEHKGHLADKSDIYLIEAAMDEAVDSYTYLYTLREKLKSKGKKPMATTYNS